MTQDHLDAPDFLNGGTLHVGQIDRVISAGRRGRRRSNPDTPRTGSSTSASKATRGRLTPDDVTGVVVHTDLRRTGWFRCSDERINRFHEITDWSFRDNACEIPTDCPQRERAGWTGDYQVFLPIGGVPVRRRRLLA